ncbi:hypothetical protein CSKR_111771 [Clonorchis sinensis]|uniref:Uncharacterized protein n=1 Tax=Clonorchis sinensis TaxID=79923 RepID=A0A3R7F8N7_CLOSI|nr:hypothetical protein CSKR_111771 [Clonorchis sinensis]
MLKHGVYNMSSAQESDELSLMSHRGTVVKFSLVVDQMAVDLFAELDNWLANVLSPVEETSSVRRGSNILSCYWLIGICLLGTKRLQANCQARRTDQLPSDQPPVNPPKLPIFRGFPSPFSHLKFIAQTYGVRKHKRSPCRWHECTGR